MMYCRIKKREAPTSEILPETSGRFFVLSALEISGIVHLARPEYKLTNRCIKLPVEYIIDRASRTSHDEGGRRSLEQKDSEIRKGKFP